MSDNSNRPAGSVAYRCLCCGHDKLVTKQLSATGHFGTATQVFSFLEMETEFLRRGIEMRVCPECGYISLFEES